MNTARPVRAIDEAGSERETPLLRKIRFALNGIDGVRVWRRNVGFDRSRGIKYGTPGEADLQGIAHGRPFAVEVKSKRGKLSDDQIRWIATWRGLGGIAVVAYSLEAAVEAAELARVP